MKAFKHTRNRRSLFWSFWFWLVPGFKYRNGRLYSR